MSDKYEAKFLIVEEAEVPTAELLIHADNGGMCRTSSFWSKQEGRNTIVNMSLYGRINDEEKYHLAEKLRLSSLPETREEATELRQDLHKQ